MKPSGRGHSLIEMILIMSIVAFLAAMAIPTYNKSVEKKKAAGARDSLQTLATAIHAYEREYITPLAPSSIASLMTTLSAAGFVQYGGGNKHELQPGFSYVFTAGGAAGERYLVATSLKDSTITETYVLGANRQDGDHFL